jgi:hypothetical protein
MSAGPPEGPATPDQPESGFEEGLETPPEEERVGRFSEGQEDLPETPEKLEEGRFSEGQEDLPETPEKLEEGRFSEGQEQLGDEDPEKHHHGGFGEH